MATWLEKLATEISNKGSKAALNYSDAVAPRTIGMVGGKAKQVAGDLDPAVQAATLIPNEMGNSFDKYGVLGIPGALLRSSVALGGGASPTPTGMAALSARSPEPVVAPPSAPIVPKEVPYKPAGSPVAPVAPPALSMEAPVVMEPTEPALKVPEYKGRARKSLNDILGAVGYGNGRGSTSTPEGVIAANMLANAMIGDEDTQTNDEEKLYNTQVAALPHYAMANATTKKLPAEIANLASHGRYFDAAAKHYLAEAGATKDKNGLARQALLLKAMGKDQNKGGGLAAQAKLLSDLHGRLTMATDPKQQEQIKAMIKQYGTLPPEAFDSTIHNGYSALGERE